MNSGRREELMFHRSLAIQSFLAHFGAFSPTVIPASLDSPGVIVDFKNLA